MSFRIDLVTKNNISIYLIVIKNQLNFNFEYVSDWNAAFQMRAQFQFLLTHFKMENQTDSVRGEDPEHIKRHHIIAEEIDIPHCHVGFDENITPKILETFFNNLINTQKKFSNNCEYQFFNEEIKNNVLFPFEIYYNDFINSPRETEFMQERMLTYQEKIRLLICSRNNNCPLVESDIQLLGNDVRTKRSDRYIRGSRSKKLLKNNIGFFNHSSIVIIQTEDPTLSFELPDFC